MEVVSNFHDKIVEDLRKPEEQVRNTISEHHMTDYNELGKSLFAKHHIFFISSNTP